MSALSRFKKSLYEVLWGIRDDEAYSRWLNGGIALLIVLNVVAVILETIEPLFAVVSTVFRIFEAVSVVIFSVEYVARLWVCTCDPHFRKPLLGRLRYAISFFALIDLLAIAPFFLARALDLRYLRIVRLVRFARLLKLTRHSMAIRLLGRTLQRSREELVVTSYLVLMVLVISSSLMYFLEHEAQPDKFSSIPAAMWWGAVTLTTVGYGDIFPVTPLGKLVASVMAFVAIGMYALPTGIIASNFMEELRHDRKMGPPLRCPHCGELVNDSDPLSQKEDA